MICMYSYIYIYTYICMYICSPHVYRDILNMLIRGRWWENVAQTRNTLQNVLTCKTYMFNLHIYTGDGGKTLREPVLIVLCQVRLIVRRSLFMSLLTHKTSGGKSFRQPVLIVLRQGMTHTQ